MSAAEIVQRQLEAYNAQDLEAFCATYADDCIIADLNGAVTQAGADAIRARYAKTFSDFPKNRAWVEHRMCLAMSLSITRRASVPRKARSSKHL